MAPTQSRGTKYFRKMLCKFQDTIFFEPDISEGPDKVGADICLQIMVFAVAIAEDSWLPEKSIDASTAKYMQRYKEFGSRLAKIDEVWDHQWQDVGYFTRVPNKPNCIVLSVGAGQGKVITLPFPSDEMQEITDWKFHTNWTTGAYLDSDSTGHTFHLRELFLVEFGQSMVDRWIPKEMKSFEPGGVSPPASIAVMKPSGRRRPLPRRRRRVAAKGKLLHQVLRRRLLMRHRIRASAAGRAAATSPQPRSRRPPPPPEGLRSRESRVASGSQDLI